MAEQRFARSDKPYVAVLVSGLLTTALTLAGVYWLGRNTEDFFIMVWYANYVIPIGAMIVGIAASSGYAVASWVSGTRISRGLLLAVLLLQAGAYVTAEYVEYRDVMDDLRKQGVMIGQQPSFLQYYDFKARSFAWEEPGPGNKPGKPLGAWGYAFVLLGAAGFILSGLIAPAVLYTVPYCEPCQRYMKTKLLGVMPASVPVKKIAKNDQAAQEAHAKEQEQASVRADEALARLQAAIEKDRTDTFQQELVAAGSIKENEKLPKRVRVSLVWCKCCGEGKIDQVLVSAKGDKVQQQKLAEHPVTATFVAGIVKTPATPS